MVRFLRATEAGKRVTISQTPTVRRHRLRCTFFVAMVFLSLLTCSEWVQDCEEGLNSGDPAHLKIRRLK